MTTQPVASPEAAALEHAAQQAAIRNAALVTTLSLWQAAPGDLLGWWFGGGRDEVFTTTALAQELMASDATPYVVRSLAEQGFEVETSPVNPMAFAGRAADGRALDTLLDLVPFRAVAARQAGMSEAESRQRGEELLRRIVFTETTDAGREADGVAVAATDIVAPLAPTREARRVFSPEEIEQLYREMQDPFVQQPRPSEAEPTRREREERLAERKKKRPVPVGWIRVLTPPSCGRCAVLAGKWYGWNDGFLRHENCDCRHIPCPEITGKDMTTDPRQYFESLTETQQNELFGKANAQAIRDGGDVAQVVNAATRQNAVYTVDGRRYTTEGTTRRGFYGRTPPGKKGVRRPTPVQIYRDAGKDQEMARRLLTQFGYIEP